jgi:hypothetical protein
MNGEEGFIAAFVLIVTGIFLLVQLAVSVFVVLRFIASPDRSAVRPFLLTIATALASVGMCYSQVFPRAFIHGLCSRENQVDLFLYLFAMFIGLLFSYELIWSRSRFFRLVGAFGMFFLVVNSTPGISDYVYQAQYTPKHLSPSKPLEDKATSSVPQKVVQRQSPQECGTCVKAGA